MKENMFGRKVFLTAWSVSLAIVAILVLAGCQDSGVKGKTFYNFAADDGDETVLVFDDSDGWHMSNGSKEAVGTWQEEDGNIVLIYSGTAAGTLTKTEDGKGWVFVDDAEYDAGYYEDEDAARQATDDLVATFPDRVKDLLESATWTDSKNEKSKVTSEIISFDSGEASYTAGVYDQGTYIFKQGPSDGDWTASDHSGAYEVTVDKFSKGSSGFSSLNYQGTLTIDGQEVTYKLVPGESSSTLTIGDTYTVVFESE